MIGLYDNHLDRLHPEINSYADWSVPWEDRLDPWENYEDEDDYLEEEFDNDDLRAD